MKVALVNPPWRFDSSIYFGCREPHLPLELGYTKALLDAAGHDSCWSTAISAAGASAKSSCRVADFAPDMTVVTTAPSYLFWRCAPPELRVPRDFVLRARGRGGRTVAVGPHGSVTPETAMRKLGVDVVVRGECEEVWYSWRGPPTLPCAVHRLRRGEGDVRVTGAPRSTLLRAPGPALADEWVGRHTHHHHRFEAGRTCPARRSKRRAAVPTTCSFCAKIDFRDKYRRRDLGILLG